MDPGDPRLTLPAFLREVAARHGPREAIVSRERRVTYAELYSEARALARGLVGAGVVKGARVALWMSNRPEWVIAAYAVGMAGGVLVPVNTFASRRERDHVLRHGDASVLLMQSGLLSHRYLDDLFSDHPATLHGLAGRLRVPGLPQLRRIACLDLAAPRGGVEPWTLLHAAGDDVSETLLDALSAEVLPSDDALVIYTSGTTAQPKGVVHTQRAPVLQAWRFAEWLRFTPDERVYTTYPFFWTAGIAMSIGGTLAAGGTLLVEDHFEPGAALEMMERERATALHAWPHQQKAMGEHASAASRDLSHLRKVDFAGPLAKLAGLREDVYGTGGSYGLSETFTIASALPTDAPAAARAASNGPAWPGNHIRIVDPQSGAPRAMGVEGEIVVKGATTMRGYHKVLPEQVFDLDGWFHTQDGGQLDAQGQLHWTGRLSNLIKTGGANVSPVEIQELLESHPQLRVAIPVGLEHPTLGEAIVLCAVAVEGAEPREEEVRGWLRERLAAYKVPKRVLFFRPGELAYTANQKVQVAPLRDAALRRLREERAVIDGHRYETSEE
ncbi:MAG TPA: class I adenylate-forming enzyme family protein [Myxococcota bacterium]|nr:class I adenylate-forming enzyme family protein [Myxococcota bacterium]